jgi:molybdate transport repressor ModE-like protein
LNYAAVITAAGTPAFAHEFKPMLHINDNTAIINMIRTFEDAGIGEIVVVAGYKAEILQKHLERMNVRICVNQQYDSGEMFDSIKLGVKTIQGPYDYIFLTPGDVPVVKPETILLMERACVCAARPIYRGKHGHPVIVSSACASEILEYKGEGGLRGAMDALGTSVADLEVDDVGVIMELDTFGDYKALQIRKKQIESSGCLWPNLYIDVAKSEIVLSQEIARFLAMIENTGSIQTACACTYMSYTKGWESLNRIECELGYAVTERSRGGTSGGGTHLTAKGKRLLTAYQRYVNAVNNEAERLFRELFSEIL